ncbi:hypothetical protein DM860_010350 [Cuscuta australis]|uniref:Uncharacterized protein n=1 Tax=Cuscuta australis TaxID=267555 RepID=A0A328E0Y1_9ASTE|nr:hypothetical protein DM860_010350 [Cuscuta australis]
MPYDPPCFLLQSMYDQTQTYESCVSNFRGIQVVICKVAGGHIGTGGRTSNVREHVTVLLTIWTPQEMWLTLFLVCDRLINVPTHLIGKQVQPKLIHERLAAKYDIEKDSILTKP